jgi:large subunit ribosomal protein L21
MYAIVKTGGKQYRVEAGRTLEVERLPQGEGETVELGDVLMIAADGDVTVGTPLIDGARVLASVEEHGKAPKIVVYKYKNKVRTRKKTGHRQQFTRLTVEQILRPGEEAKAIERKPRKREAFVPADGNLDSEDEAAEAIVAAGRGAKVEPEKAPARARAKKVEPKAEAPAAEPAETFTPEDGSLDTEEEAAEAMVAAGKAEAKAPRARKTAPAKAEKPAPKAKAPAKAKASTEDKPKTTRRRLPLGRKKKDAE